MTSHVGRLEHMRIRSEVDSTLWATAQLLILLEERHATPPPPPPLVAHFMWLAPGCVRPGCMLCGGMCPARTAASVAFAPRPFSGTTCRFEAAVHEDDVATVSWLLRTKPLNDKHVGAQLRLALHRHGGAPEHTRLVLTLWDAVSQHNARITPVVAGLAASRGHSVVLRRVIAESAAKRPSSDWFLSAAWGGHADCLAILFAHPGLREAVEPHVPQWCAIAAIRGFARHRRETDAARALELALDAGGFDVDSVPSVRLDDAWPQRAWPRDLFGDHDTWDALTFALPLLMEAARMGSEALVAVVLQHGADVAVRVRTCLWTSLHVAAAAAAPQAVRDRLVAAGVEVDATAADGGRALDPTWHNFQPPGWPA